MILNIMLYVYWHCEYCIHYMLSASRIKEIGHVSLHICAGLHNDCLTLLSLSIVVIVEINKENYDFHKVCAWENNEIIAPKLNISICWYNLRYKSVVSLIYYKSIQANSLNMH